MKFLSMLILLTSLQAKATTFQDPRWEGKPFQATSRLADIACYLLTFSDVPSYKAASFSIVSWRLKDLPVVRTDESTGKNYVSYISRASRWIGTENYPLVLSTIRPEDIKAKVDVIENLECY